MTLFVDILRKYYSSLTLSEIKLAFEFAAVGKLDNYLTKNKDGSADKAHYQTFSVDYVSRILNAYKLYRDKTKVDLIGKNSKLKSLSSGEIVKNREKNINYLIQCFDAYKNHGRRVTFFVPKVYCDYLYNVGLMEEIPEPDKKEKDLLKLFSKTLNMEDSVREEPTEDSRTKAIYEIFDKLINYGEHLQEYF